MWTGKEAITKVWAPASPPGSSEPRSFWATRGRAAVDADLELVFAWRLVAFRPAPAYLATLAVSAGVQVLRYSVLLVDLADTMPGRVITR